MQDLVIGVNVKNTEGGKPVTELVVQQEKVIATTIFGSVAIPYKSFVPCKLSFEDAKRLIGMKFSEIEL